jgi:hypothetical protein
MSEMNEIAIENPAFAAERQAPRGYLSLSGWGTELSAYVLLVLLIALGWLIRNSQFISPKDGVGYWLGIAGGTLMLLLLLYPLRKRMKILHRLGPTKHWFQMHIILGLVGPLMILYHCNFQLGSVNSRVALYCMLLVAGSGIIGRHFYSHIHRGLDGHRATMRELQQELSASVEKNHGLAKLMPELAGKLDEMSEQLRGHQITQTIGIGRSLRWTFSHQFLRLSLVMTARRELRAAAAMSETVAADQGRLKRSISKYIKDYTSLVGQVSQFSFYERLFALWHFFHLPTFFIMVLAASFHVLAVHMY